MDLKYYLGDVGKFLGTGYLFKDHPEWAFITIVVLYIINKVYKYLMRNHRVISDKYIDANGNEREIHYTDKH